MRERETCALYQISNMREKFLRCISPSLFFWKILSYHHVLCWSKSDGRGGGCWARPGHHRSILRKNTEETMEEVRLRLSGETPLTALGKCLEFPTCYGVARKEQLEDPGIICQPDLDFPAACCPCGPAEWHEACLRLNSTAGAQPGQWRGWRRANQSSIFTNLLPEPARSPELTSFSSYHGYLNTFLHLMTAHWTLGPWGSF